MRTYLLLWMIGVGLTGILPAQEGGKKKEAPKEKSPRSHSDRLFFQPAIYYSDDKEPALSGSGFYIIGPENKLFALTSAHFFDFDSRQVDRVEWLGAKDQFKAGSFTSSYGNPGKAGTDEPPDYRGDFVLFEHEGPEPDCLALRLNQQRRPIAKGDNFWFPYRKDGNSKGWAKMEVIVSVATEKYIEVTLAKEIDGMGRSGSPLLTNRHNKVVGLLVSGGKTAEGKMFLQFSPVRPILQHLKKPQKKVVLSTYRSD